LIAAHGNYKHNPRVDYFNTTFMSNKIGFNFADQMLN